MKSFIGRSALLLASLFVIAVEPACIPDYPESIFADAAILKHPSVIAAFEELGRNLSALYFNTTRDGLSFAVVGARKSVVPIIALTAICRFTPQHLASRMLSTMVASSSMRRLRIPPSIMSLQATPL